MYAFLLLLAVLVCELLKISFHSSIDITPLDLSDDGIHIKHRQNDGQILKKLLKYYKVKNFTIHNDLKIHKIRDVKACLIEAFFEQ